MSKRRLTHKLEGPRPKKAKVETSTGNVKSVRLSIVPGTTQIHTVFIEFHVPQHAEHVEKCKTLSDVFGVLDADSEMREICGVFPDASHTSVESVESISDRDELVQSGPVEDNDWIDSVLQ